MVYYPSQPLCEGKPFMFHFVAVKMAYKFLLESPVFSNVPLISCPIWTGIITRIHLKYVETKYHSCMHKGLLALIKISVSQYPFLLLLVTNLAEIHLSVLHSYERNVNHCHPTLTMRRPLWVCSHISFFKNSLLLMNLWQSHIKAKSRSIAWRNHDTLCHVDKPLS